MTKQSGQSLMELIIAIAVIVIGLFAVWTLFLVNYNGEVNARNRIVAVNLAREGAEAVKNIRDSNWLRVANNENACGGTCYWYSGLNHFESRVIGLLTNDVALESISGGIDSDEARIYFNAQGFYDHNSSDQLTAYRRLITIKDICCVDSDNDYSCDSLTNFDNLVAQDNNSHDINSGRCSDGSLLVGFDVESQVRWSIGGNNYDVTIQNQIFNWR